LTKYLGGFRCRRTHSGRKRTDPGHRRITPVPSAGESSAYRVPLKALLLAFRPRETALRTQLTEYLGGLRFQGYQDRSMTSRETHFSGFQVRFPLTYPKTGFIKGAVDALSDSIRAELHARRLSNGCWSWVASGCQAALEPTCLALLALHRAAGGPEALLNRQLRDGSWASFDGDTEPSGLTGLALLTLNALGIEDVQRQRTETWLIHTRGRESVWPWKWKFRTLDTRAQFNPAKFGWPWQPATCSWVVPTAFALLALKQSAALHRNGKLSDRVRHGIEMLLDRVCPEGGWNAGNGVVYEHPMLPHIDATAITLLALQHEAPAAITTLSLRWLEEKMRSWTSPWSLAWAILAFHVYDRELDFLRDRLSRTAKPTNKFDSATLAVAALALDCTTDNNPFRVYT
jgi:hypothetical protein